MGSGNHGNLPTHLEIHTRSEGWSPNFHEFLDEWRALRNCADYNLFMALLYIGLWTKNKNKSHDNENLDKKGKMR